MYLPMKFYLNGKFNNNYIQSSQYFSKLEKLKNSQTQWQVRILILVLKFLVRKTFLLSPNLSPKISY